jgi:hypothetical protein
MWRDGNVKNFEIDDIHASLKGSMDHDLRGNAGRTAEGHRAPRGLSGAGPEMSPSKSNQTFSGRVLSIKCLNLTRSGNLAGPNLGFRHSGGPTHAALLSGRWSPTPRPGVERYAHPVKIRRRADARSWGWGDRHQAVRQRLAELGESPIRRCDKTSAGCRAGSGSGRWLASLCATGNW